MNEGRTLLFQYISEQPSAPAAAQRGWLFAIQNSNYGRQYSSSAALGWVWCGWDVVKFFFMLV